uniref:Zinc finger CCCH domain containing protein 31 n=1 Tax=Echinococcus granulosus TaxID=6210 RepID=A0A068WW36_ECHGR|nr:zinc finger CCCH domain containing protein 31 [Echinococcus granulosus]
MGDPDKKICRYFNAVGGCWDKSSTGCRFGENCHFSHDCASLKVVEQPICKVPLPNEQVLKDNKESGNTSGRNNNNMAISSRLIITEPPKTADSSKSSGDTSAEVVANSEEKINNNTVTSAEEAVADLCPHDKDLMPKLMELSEFPSDSNFQQEQLTLDSQIMCGTCKQILERRGNESYCNLLKDHYLECFLDKEGDHVKCVKLKAALEPGQMYWCKSCILIFEKPWSLFQHMADKAKGAKVQRWEKKVHLDWIDSVAGLMAGHDLGLFSLMKLRTDLRNLLADQHTMEEEMEAAAVAAAAMVQWLAPISSPWRLHQREMMRKIENFHRQMLRRAGGAAAIARAAFAGGSNCFPFLPPSPSGVCGRFGTRTFRGAIQQQHQQQPFLESAGDHPTPTPPSLVFRDVDENGQPVDEAVAEESTQEEVENPDASVVEESENNEEVVAKSELHVAGASGDHPSAPPPYHAKNQQTQDNAESETPSISTNKQANSNNTNSAAALPCPRGDIGIGGRGSLSGFGRATGRSFRGGISSANRNKPLNSAHRHFDRPRLRSVSQSLRQITSPTRLDLNCGFTDEEVEELLCQGIKPWDSEASAALAVLHVSSSLLYLQCSFIPPQIFHLSCRSTFKNELHEKWYARTFLTCTQATKLILKVVLKKYTSHLSKWSASTINCKRGFASPEEKGPQCLVSRSPGACVYTRASHTHNLCGFSFLTLMITKCVVILMFDAEYIVNTMPPSPHFTLLSNHGVQIVKVMMSS